MIPKHMRDQYTAYIASPAWKQLRNEMVESTYISDGEAGRDGWDLARGRYRCQNDPDCGWNFHNHELEVHHLHYDTLGHESPSDLVVVCKSCHEKLDRKRAREGRRKSLEAYEEAGFQAWAEKVYGEGWAMYHEESEVWEAFLEWLEEKDEDGGH